MKRNAQKTGIYDEDNGKALIGRLYKEITGKTSKELIISYKDFAYKVILGEKEVFITKKPFDVYYKNYSNKSQRDWAIKEIKDKIHLLLA